MPVAGLFQLESRPRSLLDRPCPRERSAIRYYGAGRSHKEVAWQMEISPTTVRQYLRCAYRRLGMHDNSEIPSVLGAADGATREVPAGAGREPGLTGRPSVTVVYATIWFYARQLPGGGI